MKTLLCTIFFLPVFAWAQDTTTVDQYCEATISTRVFPARVELNVKYGIELRQVITGRKYEVEPKDKLRFRDFWSAFNYMAKQGWQLVPITTVGLRPSSLDEQEIFVFRKKFLRSELAGINTDN